MGGASGLGLTKEGTGQKVSAVYSLQAVWTGAACWLSAPRALRGVKGNDGQGRKALAALGFFSAEDLTAIGWRFVGHEKRAKQSLSF